MSSFDLRLLSFKVLNSFLLSEASYVRSNHANELKLLLERVKNDVVRESEK